LLDYRDLGHIDPAGNPHAFGLVTAHRIESGFYANLSDSTDYFSFADQRSIAPLVIPDLQRLAANFGNLFRREGVTTTAAVLDLFSAALYTAVRAPNEQIRELVGAVIDHSRRAGDLTDEKAAFLKAIPWGATAKSVALFAFLSTPLAFVNTFVGSIFLRLVASGFGSSMSDAKTTIQEEFGSTTPVSAGDAPSLQEAGAQLLILKSRGDLRTELGAVDPEGLARHLAGGSDWESATLEFVQSTPDLAADERVALDASFGASMYGAVLATPEMDSEYLEEFWSILTDHFEETGREIANSNPDLMRKYENVDAGSFAPVEDFRTYDLIHDSLAEAAGDPRNAGIKHLLERELSIVESAGQVVEVRTFAAKPADPFDNPDFRPESAEPASDRLLDGDSGTYTLFLPYEAGEGGQKIRITLSGANADQFAVISHGQELEASGGEFTLTVAEGRRSVNFAIWPTDDFHGTETLAIDATLVDADGNATHRTHPEANLSLVDLTDVEFAAVFNAQPRTEVLTGTRDPITSDPNDPRSRRTQLNGTDLADYIVGNHASGEINAGAGNDYIFEEWNTTGFFKDADDIYAGAGNDWVFGSLGSVGRVIDLGEGDDFVKAVEGPKFVPAFVIPSGHPIFPPGFLHAAVDVSFADFAPALRVDDDSALPFAGTDGALQFGVTFAFG